MNWYVLVSLHGIVSQLAYDDNIIIFIVSIFKCAIFTQTYLCIIERYWPLKLLWCCPECKKQGSLKFKTVVGHRRILVTCKGKSRPLYVIGIHGVVHACTCVLCI